jgi:uncharacterized membrane protein
MTTSQRLLTVFWLAAGINHFVNPKIYESIMPDYLPAHRELVLWSGVAEIVAGLAVISERTRNPFARWWILGVLAAVFPANVHMTLNPERYKQIPEAALWARLPLQFAAAWWAWKATAARPASPTA